MEQSEPLNIVEQDFEFNFAEFTDEDLVERIRQFETGLRTLELPLADQMAMDRETKHMVFEYWCRRNKDK